MTDEEIIKIMEKTNNLWNDRKRLEQLEKENAELKAKLNGALDICNIPEFRISDLEKENEQLKQQIEKMKSCINCKYDYLNDDECYGCRLGNKLKNWEFAY